MKRALLLIGAMLIAFVPAFSDCGSHDVWDSILKNHVTTDGYVDYEGLRAQQNGAFSNYLQGLASFNTDKCTDKGRLAFWINAYNAHMIRLVLARPKMKLVSEDFKLFDEKFQVAGHMVSLNDIEHRVIRSDPKKGGPIPGLSISKLDSRAHFALVCGAIDCPKLLNRAYREQDLEATLQSNAVQFANNPKHIRIENNRLVVSTLMKWYEDDFSMVGGAGPYLVSLSQSELIDQKLKSDYPSKVTFKYDWTLNSIKNKKEK